VLEPLIEEGVRRTEFLLNRLHNGAHEVALFSGERKRHQEFLRGLIKNDR
jgi:hypothetical protein